jgi:hypothetical protein
MEKLSIQKISKQDIKSSVWRPGLDYLDQRPIWKLGLIGEHEMKILFVLLVFVLPLTCTMFGEYVLAKPSDPTISSPSSGTNPSAESTPSSHSPSTPTQPSSSRTIPSLICPTGQTVTALDQCPNSNPSLNSKSFSSGLVGSHNPQELASTSLNLTKSVIDCFTKGVHTNQSYTSTEVIHKLISCFVEGKHSRHHILQ